MIQPTPGRIVWYYKDIDQTEPNAAIVVKINSGDDVNLTVFRQDGTQHPELNVYLYQPEYGDCPKSEFCEWMPYQLGQAARTQQAEQKVAETTK